MRTRLFELPVQFGGLLTRKNLKAIATGILRSFPGSKVSRKGDSLFIETAQPLNNTELFEAVKMATAFRCAHEFDYVGSKTVYGLCEKCKAARAEIGDTLKGPVQRVKPIPPRKLTFEQELDALEAAAGLR